MLRIVILEGHKDTVVVLGLIFFFFSNSCFVLKTDHLSRLSICMPLCPGWGRHLAIAVIAYLFFNESVSFDLWCSKYLNNVLLRTVISL